MDNNQKVREEGREIISLANKSGLLKKDLDGEIRGIVILDISDARKTYRKQVAPYAIKLPSLLSKFSTPHLFWLGCSISIGELSDERSEINSTLLNDYLPNRLIGPIFEELDPADFSYVLLISGGTILDFDDWVDTYWVDKIIQNSIGNEIERISDIQSLYEATPEQLVNAVKQLLF
jgi:hypothetical protein